MARLAERGKVLKTREKQTSCLIKNILIDRPFQLSILVDNLLKRIRIRGRHSITMAMQPLFCSEIIQRRELSSLKSAFYLQVKRK